MEEKERKEGRKFLMFIQNKVQRSIQQNQLERRDFVRMWDGDEWRNVRVIA